MLKNCLKCGVEFNAERNSRKYCGRKCHGLANRKYEFIDGMSRQQRFWANNDESRIKCLKRDRDKRYIVIDYLGGKCIKCGFNKDKRALVLDHINGDGKQDRLKNGSRIYRYYCTRLDEADKVLQVLCANCNLIKAFECFEYAGSKRKYFTGIDTL